jgi:hypothetical protein
MYKLINVYPDKRINSWIDKKNNGIERIEGIEEKWRNKGVGKL